jgi:tryptophan-rich sensory protein
MEVLLFFIFATAIVFQITCMSLVFAKADKPSWGCIVPVYGIILLCDIVGKPRWWTLLCIIPFVNTVAYIILSIDVARNFEKSDGFGVGLILLPVIFYAVLAFGDSDYSPFEPEQTKPAVRAPSVSPVTRPLREVTSDASPMTRPQREVASASDSVKQRPRLARCPSCRSNTFRVVEEAGIRRCSSCHSVMPSYIQGNE